MTAVLSAVASIFAQAANLSRGEVQHDPNAMMCGVRNVSPEKVVGAVLALPGLTEIQRTEQWIAKSDGSTTVWTIATAANRAYPTAVCRRLVSGPHGGTSVETEITCGASQTICDGVRDEFDALNEKMRRSLSGR